MALCCDDCSAKFRAETRRECVVLKAAEECRKKQRKYTARLLGLIGFVLKFFAFVLPALTQCVTAGVMLAHFHFQPRHESVIHFWGDEEHIRDESYNEMATFLAKSDSRSWESCLCEVLLRFSRDSFLLLLSESFMEKVSLQTWGFSRSEYALELQPERQRASLCS